MKQSLIQNHMRHERTGSGQDLRIVLYKVSWCFTRSQPVRLYQGDMLYKSDQ